MVLGLNFTGNYPDIGLIPLPTLAQTLVQESTPLNDVPGGMTFTRATSAYDPYWNTIVAPGQRRRRGMPVSRFQALQADLIEGARTNLLAAGTSDNMSLAAWAASGCSAARTGVGPDGSVWASVLTEDSSNGVHRVRQNLAKAGSALAYCITTWVKRGSGTRNIYVQVGNTGITASATGKFDLTAITATPSAVTFTSVTADIVLEGGFYKCRLMFTSDTDTGLAVFLQMATTSNSYQGDGASSLTVFSSLEQAAFGSSYISNRNLIPSSNNLSGSGWNAGGTCSVAHNGGALPTGETGWTVTITDNTGKISRAVTVTAGAAYTFSWQAKIGTATAPQYLVYDLTHSAVIAQAVYSPRRASYGRQVVSFTAPAGCTSVGIYPVYGVNAATVGTVLIGDVQTEPGSVATGYWGTNATVGGRDSDILLSTSALPIASGTFLFLGIPYGWGPDQAGVAFRPFEDTANTGIFCTRTASGQVQVRRYDAGGAESASGVVTPWASGTLLQLACVWDAVSVRGFVNGVASGTPDTSLTPPYTAGTGTITLGTGGTGTEFYGWVGILAWSRALAASELLAINTALPTAA